MKLKVLPAVLPKYRNEFIVRVKFMHGDGDLYETLDIETVTEFITLGLIKELKSLKKYFTDIDNLTSYRYPYIYTYLITVDFSWPCDKFGPEGERSAALDSYEVFYYDKQGVEHSVAITK